MKDKEFLDRLVGEASTNDNGHTQATPFDYTEGFFALRGILRMIISKANMIDSPHSEKIIQIGKLSLEMFDVPYANPGHKNTVAADRDSV